MMMLHRATRLWIAAAAFAAVPVLPAVGSAQAFGLNEIGF